MPNDYANAPYSLAQQMKKKDPDPQNKSRIVIEPMPKEESPADRARRKLGVVNRFGHDYQEKEFSSQEPVKTA